MSLAAAAAAAGCLANPSSVRQKEQGEQPVEQSSIGEEKEEERQGAQSLPPPCSLLESVFKTDFVSCLVFPRNVIDYVIAAS